MLILKLKGHHTLKTSTGLLQIQFDNSRGTYCKKISLANTGFLYLKNQQGRI